MVLPSINNKLIKNSPTGLQENHFSTQALNYFITGEYGSQQKKNLTELLFSLILTGTFNARKKRQ